jgi:multicomponent K+:H+ antiporter subunit G
MADLSMVVTVTVTALLVIGACFLVIGAIGLVRFGDFYMRLHAPTKATTLGVGGILLASMVTAWSQGQLGLRELLIALFVFVTAPVSANLIAKAAIHRRVHSNAPLPEDFQGPTPAAARPTDDPQAD